MKSSIASTSPAAIETGPPPRTNIGSPILYDLPPSITVILVTIEKVSATTFNKRPWAPKISDSICSPFIKEPTTVFGLKNNSNGKPKFKLSVITFSTALSTIALAPEDTPLTLLFLNKL